MTTRPVWEETWTTVGNCIVADRRDWSDDLPTRFVWEGGTNFGAFGTVRMPMLPPVDTRDRARARLAAQAPAMARLLLKHRYKTGKAGGCIGCGRIQSEGCEAKCRVRSVLRAAGVIE
jgi:hypothetical protein